MGLGGGRIHLQGPGKAMLNPLDFTLGVKGSHGRFEQENEVIGFVSQISLTTGQGVDFFFFHLFENSRGSGMCQALRIISEQNRLGSYPYRICSPVG